MDTMEIDYAKQPGLIPGQPPEAVYSEWSGLIPAQLPQSPPSTLTTSTAHEPKINEPPPFPNQYQNLHSLAGYAYPQSEPPQRDHRICGLRPVTFWLLLALLIVIIAAAIGGGVGGSMAVSNAKTQCLGTLGAVAAVSQSASSSTASSSLTSNTATPTSSSTIPSLGFSAGATTTAWGPLQTTLPYSGCPDNNGGTYTSYFPNSKYRIYCNLDIPYTGTSDLLYVITPTFELCMEACSSWNDNGKKNGGVTVGCSGIAFIPSHVNGDGAGMPADCVLKTGPNVTATLAANLSYQVHSAVLI